MADLKTRTKQLGQHLRRQSAQLAPAKARPATPTRTVVSAAFKMTRQLARR
jgi:hypothetical protein